MKFLIRDMVSTVFLTTDPLMDFYCHLHFDLFNCNCGGGASSLIRSIHISEITRGMLIAFFMLGNPYQLV